MAGTLYNGAIVTTCLQSLRAAHRVVTSVYIPRLAEALKPCAMASAGVSQCAVHADLTLAAGGNLEASLDNSCLDYSLEMHAIITQWSSFCERFAHSKFSDAVVENNFCTFVL